MCDLPVMLEDLKAKIDFIVLPNVPFDMVIGRPTLKRLGGALDFKREVVAFD